MATQQNGMWLFKQDLLGSSGISNLQELVSKGIFNVYVNVGFPSPTQGSPTFPELSGFVPDNEVGIFVSQSEVQQMNAKLAQVDSRLKLWAWFGTFAAGDFGDLDGHHAARISVNTSARRSAIINACLSIMSWGFYGAQDDAEDFKDDSRESTGQWGTTVVTYFNEFAAAFQAAGYPVHTFVWSGWYNFNNTFLSGLTQPSAIIMAGHNGSGSEWKQLAELFFNNAQRPLIYNFGYSSIRNDMVNGLAAYPYSSVASKLIGYSFYDMGYWSSDWSVWDDWPNKIVGDAPSPSPPPGPTPSPPPVETGEYVRRNYMLNSEAWNDYNNSITISSATNPPAGVASWNTLTGNTPHTGGATKFCNIPDGDMGISLFLERDSVNFALVKIQPNTYNKAYFVWVSLTTGVITHTRAVNWPNEVFTSLEEVETSKYRLKLITSLSDGVQVGIEVLPVSGSEVYASAATQSIKAGGIKFESDNKVTNYFPSTSTVAERILTNLAISSDVSTFGIGATAIVSVTATDDQDDPWEQQSIGFDSNDDSIATFSNPTATTDSDGVATTSLTGVAAGSTSVVGFLTAELTTDELPITINSALSPISASVSQTMLNFIQSFTVETLGAEPEPLPAIELGVNQTMLDFTQTVTAVLATIQSGPAVPTLIVGKSGVSPVVMVGTGVVGAEINIYVDGVLQSDTVEVDSDGVWSTSLDLDEGTYIINASQVVDGLNSSFSNTETLTVLAVGEGGNRFRSGSGTGPRKAIRPAKPTKNFSWPTK